MNTFDRIVMSALQAPFSGAVNLSAGSPLDYMKTPVGFSTTSPELGPRKSGANLITLTKIGSDGGFNDDFGPSFSYGADSTVGAGSNVCGHIMTDQVFGNGWRFEVDVGAVAYSGLWPDALWLRVWDITYSIRQTSFSASIVGDSDAVPYAEHIGPPNTENDEFTAQALHLTDVVFSSEVPGSTFRLDLTRNGGSMGNWGIMACALYAAPYKTFRPRGGMGGSLSRVRS